MSGAPAPAASPIPASTLDETALAQATNSGAFAVEDIDRGIHDEQAFFHLLNLARERSMSVLMTSRRAPGEIEIALPDLRSRLRALPIVPIGTPDETLLKALLVKFFRIASSSSSPMSSHTWQCASTVPWPLLRPSSS